MVEPDPCIFESARRAFGFDARQWADVLRGFADVDSVAELYRDTPEAREGGRQLLDFLVVNGFRHPRLLLVSADYLVAMLRRRVALAWTDAEIAPILSDLGHPAGFPLLALDAPAFRALAARMEAAGAPAFDLRRSWMTRPRLRSLGLEAALSGIDDDVLASAVATFGGGSERPEDLDEEGFERVRLALWTARQAATRADELAALGRDRRLARPTLH